MTEESSTPKKAAKGPAGARLFVPATVLGYQRGRHAQHCGVSLLRIEGLRCREDAAYYVGKKVAFMWVPKSLKKQPRTTPVKEIWGKIVAEHGNSGVVRARFSRNLSSSFFGKSARVYMFPSRS